MPNQPIEIYSNRTLHGGVNQRLNGRQIADNEATDLINADISIPGLRTKRREPSLVTTLLQPTIPATPTGTTVDGGACGSVIVLSPAAFTLAWGAVVGAQSYTITFYSGSVCGGAVFADFEFAANVTSAEFAGFAVGSYSWTVQAIGDGENYADSNVSACCSFRVEDGAAVPAVCTSGNWTSSVLLATGGPVTVYSTGSPIVVGSDAPAWDSLLQYSGSCLWGAAGFDNSSVGSWLGYRRNEQPGAGWSVSGAGFGYLAVPVWYFLPGRTPLVAGGTPPQAFYIKAYGASPAGTYTAVQSGGAPATIILSWSVAP